MNSVKHVFVSKGHLVGRYKNKFNTILISKDHVKKLFSSHNFVHARHPQNEESKLTMFPRKLPKNPLLHMRNSEEVHRRDLPKKYQDFLQELEKFISADRLIFDPLRTLAYGTDASLYRLIPKIVIDVESEDEVSQILHVANSMLIPVTFRAAGTSLSGQAITDSVMLRMVPSKWSKYKILDQGNIIKVQPGLIGATVNRFLAKYEKKIGPDPASINSAMIGGIAANNASGMCCGVAQNTYNTVGEMRIIFYDGTVLDTSSQESKNQFEMKHKQMLTEIKKLSDRCKSDPELFKKIKHKYKIKNTCGYSLNSLIDFEDPYEIIKHLMIGSEGTLAFIAEIDYITVEELKFKATSLILFPDVHNACRGAALLRDTKAVAVELMDRSCLKSAENSGLVKPNLGPQVAALLIETKGKTQQELDLNIDEIRNTLKQVEVLGEFDFTSKPEEFTKLWSLRKALLPMVGAMRENGTSVITEDVAVPVKSLADLIKDLQVVFKNYKYEDAVIFGHALEGNIHIIFSQAFDTQSEINRYEDMMKELCHIVAVKYNGSLKAEHGTGRNIAPFVELEWGKDAYQVMWEIKRILDPKMIINPGVLLNEDAQISVKNLKPLPVAHDIIDKCIECGFCEQQCPSRETTLSPRQRIVIWREMEKLKRLGDTNSFERLKVLQKDYEYDGNKTCAADGMCASSCPVSIDTGKLIKTHRRSLMDKKAVPRWIANTVANNFGLSMSGGKVVLYSADLAHRLLGENILFYLSNTMSLIARKMKHDLGVPTWNQYTPTPASININQKISLKNKAKKVVYFPCCASRIMGPARGDSPQQSIHATAMSLFQKANLDPIHPENLDNLCCGLAFESKGFHNASDKKATELEKYLWESSEEGKLPILMDTSSCILHVKSFFKNKDLIHNIMEPVQFAEQVLLPRLKIDENKKADNRIVVHTPCSSKKMGLEESMMKIAKMCCNNEVENTYVACCGMAGDRGLSFPELPDSALKRLKTLKPFSVGYSTSRTCEIGLSLHSGVHFKSILYLLDKSSSANPTITEIKDQIEQVQTQKQEAKEEKLEKKLVFH